MTTHFSILCLENSTDRILAGYSSRGCKEFDMTEHTGMHTCRHTLGVEKMNSTIWSYYGTLSCLVAQMVKNLPTMQKTQV